jgi:hypothetical protein
MNSLITNAMFTSFVEERKPILHFVYEIIDSKIDFIELKTRKLLDKFRRKEPITHSGTHRSDDNSVLPSMSDLTVDEVENESLFVHFEQMSRSIYLLEKMKMSVREENAFSVMELLNDDKYLTVNDLQMTDILSNKTVLELQAS